MRNGMYSLSYGLTLADYLGCNLVSRGEVFRGRVGEDVVVDAQGKL